MIKDILDFLKELDTNNNRDWFNSQKKRFDFLRNEFEEFITKLISSIGKYDPEVKQIRPSECIFRIYRDTRFSHDKTPYKTNFGAFINKGGKKSGFPGYYIHLEPNSCFLAGGVYMPESAILKQIRQEIYYNPEEFLGIINNKAFKKHFGEISGEQLVNAPKDFPKDFRYIDLLKFKSYICMYKLPMSIIKDKDAIEDIANIFKIMKPFNDFLKKAID